MPRPLVRLLVRPLAAPVVRSVVRCLVPCLSLLLLVIASDAGASNGAAAATVVDRPEGQPGDLTLETRAIELEDGRVVEVEAGTLLVPENRQRPTSPALSIPFYRLRSTAADPAPPIFLLAGGPGSSWIDRFRHEENHQEVEFYRSFADVVLFDQRGGGHSRPAMDCDAERSRLPADEPVDEARRSHELQRLAERCRDRWLAAGVDLAAYNTRQNAADVLDLQAALGYPRISLVGGSYGSHLALALLRRAPERLHRVVLYGVEGPNHTWDDPDGLLATLERIAGAAEASPELGPAIPEGGLVGALETVIQRLEAEPVTVPVRTGEGEIPVVVDATALRRFAHIQAGRSSRPDAWPHFVLDLLRGDYSLLARGALALRELRLDDPMSSMMDCASGISPDRRRRLEASAATAILGDRNREYGDLCEVWAAPDLGPGFRAPVVSEVPTLVIHGTWDLSTPIGNAREVVANLSQGHLLEVVGGGHGALYNLYAHWPPAERVVGGFLRGEVARLPHSVTLPAVTFTAPSPAVSSPEPGSASAP